MNRLIYILVSISLLVLIWGCGEEELLDVELVAKITPYRVLRVNDVFVFGNYVYLCSDRFMAIFYIGDPSYPSEVGRIIQISGNQVHVSGGYAYVADGNGLRVIDTIYSIQSAGSGTV